jgi:hypothetical protein
VIYTGYSFNVIKKKELGRYTWRRQERELTGSDRLERKRCDGVVDGVRSSRVEDVAAAGGMSGTWLLAATPRLDRGHVEAEVGAALARS